MLFYFGEKFGVLGPVLDALMGGSVRFVSVLAILELTIRIAALIPDSLVLHSLVLVKYSLI